MTVCVTVRDSLNRTRPPPAGDGSPAIRVLITIVSGILISTVVVVKIGIV